jgi:hypothetical protein
MKEHNLKIWPEYFQAKLAGLKPWEHRKNDRFFKVGDKLNLREWNPEIQEYTGRKMLVEVTYIHHLKSGCAIMTDTSAQQNKAT